MPEECGQRSAVQRDQAEQAVIERRRALEEERKARVFHARHRTIGVDTAALDQQRAIRAQSAQTEKLEDHAYHQMTMHTLRALQQAEAENERVRRELNREDAEFRAANQQRHQRREWDLNDPQALRRELPGRVGDDDPRLGASCGQVFAGEDLGARGRQKQQASQLSSWFSQQANERELRRQAEMDRDHLIAMQQAEVAARVAQLEAEQEAARRAANVETANFQLEQSALRREAEMRQRASDQADNLEEIRNALDSDLLTENEGTTYNAFNPYRRVPYHFKGLSAAERQAILDQQKQQMDEAAERRRLEKEQEAAFARQQAEIARQVALNDLKVERERRALNEQHAADLRRQAAQQREKEELMNKTVYANQVRPEYFDQFNTTSR